MKLKQFIQQETVLTAAAVLAVVSAFFVPPDVQYLGYIDLRTLAILFSLMSHPFQLKDVLYETQTIHSAGNGPHRGRCAAVVSPSLFHRMCSISATSTCARWRSCFPLMTVMAGLRRQGFLMAWDGHCCPAPTAPFS